MGDCLQTGKPYQYVTNTKVNSTFHPSGVGKLSTSLYMVKAGHVHLCQVAGNTVWCNPIWRVILCSSEMGYY